MRRTGSSPGPSGVSLRRVAHLAWPATLSFLLNNAFRVNDQYWVEELGPAAQAAVGATTFVLIMNFAVLFLAAGGALSLVARATGAEDPAKRDRVVRQALLFGVANGAVLTVVGSLLAPTFVALNGLEGEVAAQAERYLGTLYLGMLPMALLPVLDCVFVGLGSTRVTLAMQVTSVTLNFALNPLLIYGAGDFEGLGIAGAALATVLSRTAAAALGLAILVRGARVPIFVRGRPDPPTLREIARIGLPNSLSIAAYAGVYWMLNAFVLADLGEAVLAGGLGIGFTVFEGLAFPFFLGIGVAVSSLVGRELGAGRAAGVADAIASGRRIGLAVGLAVAALFLAGGRLLAPVFTDDPAVLREALRYVHVLAFSQVFVALEAVNERALLGAGRTRAIVCVSVPGNLLRVPLAWLLAFEADLGAAGVWWAINVTTVLKAVALHLVVERLLRPRCIDSATPYTPPAPSPPPPAEEPPCPQSP